MMSDIRKFLGKRPSTPKPPDGAKRPTPQTVPPHDITDTNTTSSRTFPTDIGDTSSGPKTPIQAVFPSNPSISNPKTTKRFLAKWYSKFPTNWIAYSIQ